MGNDLERARREMEDATFDPPTSWVPDVGDMIVGRVARYEWMDAGGYGQRPVMVIETEDGDVRSIWLLHQVLRNEVARVKPKPGETVGVKRLEDAESADGNAYKRYGVKVFGRSREDVETPDWSEIGTGPDEEADPEELEPSDGLPF